MNRKDLNVCNNDHKKIYYKGITCPICKRFQDLVILENIISDLEFTLDEIEKEYNKTKEKLKFYNKIIKTKVLKKCPELLEYFI